MFPVSIAQHGSKDILREYAYLYHDLCAETDSGVHTIHI